MKNNNFFSNTPNNNSKEKLNKMNKAKSAKKRNLRIFDEIELKDIDIKKKISKIKQIKTDSIRQLIYTNQIIPKVWQNQKNYKNYIHEIFSKYPDFLLYIGKSNTERKIPNFLKNKKKENYKSDSLTKDKINESKNDDSKLLSQRMENKINKLTLSPIPENVIKKREIKQYLNTTPNPKHYILPKENYIKTKEVINILEELDVNYPIKEKLKDLYTNEEIEKVNKIKRSSPPIIDRRRRKQVFRNNICLNLISANNHNSIKKIKKEKKFTEKKIDINMKLIDLNKKRIKNPLIIKNLERINFYGPYYSYCSQCGVKNIDFYQKLSFNELNKITNEIRKYRNLI